MTAFLESKHKTTNFMENKLGAAVHRVFLKHLNNNLNIQKKLLKLILILVCGTSFGQTILKGKVISSITKEKPSDQIYIDELITKQGDLADSLGNFEIEYLEPNKNYIIKISVFGYKDQEFKIKTGKGILSKIFELKAECKYTKEQAEKDWKNGNPKLLIFGSIIPIGNSKADNKFEKKYNIKYFDFGCTPPIMECIKVYNERIFELMDKKYGKKWRKRVRSDVEYLE